MLNKLRKRMAVAIYPKKLYTTTSPALYDFFSGIGQLVMPGQPVYTELTLGKAVREGYKWAVPVYRAVRTIVQAGSAVPWIALDKDGEVIENHPFELLMQRPNPEMSGQDLIEYLIAHLKLAGNAIWQPIMVGRNIKEIWPIMPDLVKPIPSKKQGEWLEAWEVTDSYGKVIKIPPETYIHFMQFDPGNPYWGIGDLMAAARTVDTDNEAQDTQKVSMQNRGLNSGIISPEGEISDEQYKEATRVMKERYLDKTKRREPWIFSSNVKWQETSMTPVEMDFIQSRLQNKRDIAAAFGIDPWWVGDREHSTYNNVAEARRALYEDCIMPLLDDIESTLNLKLAPLYGDIHITYDTSNITAMREDYTKKVDQASKLFAMGVPFGQINDKLELGFEEFEGWETGYIPFNLMPTGGEAKEPDKEPAQQETEDAEKGVKYFSPLTEEQKTAHWKRIDRRRVGWWGVVSKRVKGLYEAEGNTVEKSLRGKKKEDLVNISAQTISRLRPEWERIMLAIDTVIIQDAGEDVIRELTGKSVKSFVFTETARLWAIKHIGENITSILNTNIGDVNGIILNGLNENLSTAKIASSIRQYYDKSSGWKAMRIARTEVGAAIGFGQNEAAKQTNVVNIKKWISSRDDRVRDSHLIIDGEEVPIEDYYSNGLLFPGDPGGDLAEIINCRCAEAYYRR